jgi:3-oxoacyl-[acyl-carrier-protein] synthase II
MARGAQARGGLVIRPWTSGDLAVTGAGSVTSLGPGMEGLLAGWTEGVRAIAAIRRFSTERLPVHLGAEMPDPPGPWPDGLRGAAHLDAAVEEALAQSGLSADSRTLVLVATTKGFLDDGTGSEVGGSAADPGTPARRIGARFRESECATVSTACAGGTAALVLALARADELRRGAFDAILVAGVDLLSDFVYRGFAALAAVDPAPCRPFDESRAGLSPAEAAAAVVIETAGRARARGAVPLGRLLGGGLSSDAGHPTSPDPEGVGLARAIRGAMARAGAEAADLGHVHAHGTGTVLNDAMEIRALHRALGAEAADVPLTTLKGNIGHPFGAAGVVEFAASLAAVRAGALPGIAGLDAPLRGIDASSRPRAVRSGAFLKVGAGFGGFNAALVAEGALP